jgi:hypothetical protein
VVSPEFPEAFDRFEKRVDTSKIKTFEHLRMSFALYAGRRWKGTAKQVDALADEAEKIGIPTPREERRARIREQERVRGWRHEQYTIRGKLRSIFRDVKTGRFIKNPLGGD